MADTPTTPPPPPAIAIDWKAVLGLLWQFFPSGLIKTVLGFLLAGYVAGNVVSNQIDATIKGATPKGIIEKIFPPKKKAADAIGKIQFGNAGCTATVMGPIHDGDGTIDVLTAAHCVNVGAKGKMTLPDGRTFAVTCVTRDASADVAWLRAERPGGEVPYLLLADVPPPPGTPVWHKGFGIDKPGNKEEGKVISASSSRNQVQFYLSVSPGDSGGGIICTADDRVISPVCCTTRLAGPGNVFGGSPAAAAKIRPGRTVSADEPEVLHPILPLTDQNWPEFVD